MAKKGKISSLGDVLAQSRALETEGRISWQLWREVVGTKIATRSRPENIEDGTLWVTVTSNTWAQELSLLRRTIIGRLRGRGSPIERLRFRVGEVKPLRPPALRPTVEPAALPPDLEQRLQQVDDPEMRAAIARAAGYSLGLQKTRS